jgi:hypothetical protein
MNRFFRKIRRSRKRRSIQHVDDLLIVGRLPFNGRHKALPTNLLCVLDRPSTNLYSFHGSQLNDNLASQVRGKRSGALLHQQPGGGDTPGVAVAPVVLAGAIIAGLARSIVMLSAQAEVFGVGITGLVGSRLLVMSCVMSGWIVPGGGLAGISGVESGKAAPLVGGPPGM